MREIPVSAMAYSSICYRVFQYLLLVYSNICYTPIVMPSITHKFVVSKFGGW